LWNLRFGIEFALEVSDERRKSTMRNWIGKSVAIIGAIHTVFGLVMFRQVIGEIIGEGLVNTVNGQILREFAFWFIFFGFLAVIFGIFIDWCERQQIKLPAFLGWNLLALTVLLVTIMPISGGWLLFIPTTGIFLRTFFSK
jgi:hypothetical protein